jgi:hypothetical protein
MAAAGQEICEIQPDHQLTEVKEESCSRQLLPAKSSPRGGTGYGHPPEAMPKQTPPDLATDIGVAFVYPEQPMNDGFQITGCQQQQVLYNNLGSLRSLQFWQSFQRIEMSR